LRVVCGISAEDALVDEYEVLHTPDHTPVARSGSRIRDCRPTI
jgi:hypothetical protein